VNSVLSLRRLGAVAALGAATFATTAGAAGAADGTSSKALIATLSGKHELSADGKKAGGDANGFGSVTLHREGNRLCYAVTLHHIDRQGDTPIRVWLLRGTSKVNAKSNGIRLDKAPANGDPGASSGCKSALGGRLDAIFAKPSNYYVDVFTGTPKSDWSGGAIRGQLRAAS
jgi:CHRD domain